MATIVTRTAKGSALTFAEVDGNFTNLNADGIANTSSISNLQNDKLDKSGGTMTGSLVLNSNLTTNAKVITNSAANSQSGSLVTLTTPGTEIVRLTNVLLTSLAGIQAGTAGQKLILSNRSGTTITVENESSSASTSADQICTGTGAAISIQNNASISLIYDGNLSKWNIIGGTGSGTGSAGINYIANPDASIGTTGYTPYNDGTAVPVDGSGGTPSSGLWVRSTTTPLRGSGDFNLVKTGSVSYLGQGVAYDFTIDNADLAKVLTVTFDYEVVSGTYATGDATVYIIQDPAGTPVVIQPAGYQIQSATVGTKMRQIATFQTASNVTSYRLCIHIASASTSDYTLALDTISVGPQVVQYGAPVTDWQDFPSVAAGTLITATTTNPTFGTIAVNKAQWRRVGGDMEIRWDFSQTTAGGAGSGDYRLNLPPGYSIDLTRASSGTDQSMSIGVYQYSEGSGFCSGWVHVVSATQLAATGQFQQNGTGYSIGRWSSTFNPFSVATVRIGMSARVPILGWSSTVQMSNDTDTRVVAATYYLSANQSTSAQINFDTKLIDTHNAVTTGVGTWKFTAPVPGIYTFSVGVQKDAGTGTIFFYKNNSNLRTAIVYDASFKVATTQIELLAGDFVDIRPNAGTIIIGGSPTAANAAFFNVSRLSGPSAIAASETVAASYWLSANQAVTAGVTNVNFDTREFDTHGAVTTGASWAFTAPIIGTYCVALTVETNGNTSFAAYKNGSIYKYIAVNPSANVAGGGSALIRLNAGDTINIRTNATVTVRGQLTMPSLPSQIHIHRIGN